jgi:hypothetical protein
VWRIARKLFRRFAVRTGQCPLYPRKQTFGGAIAMSALCQKQKHLGIGRAPFCRSSQDCDFAHNNSLRPCVLLRRILS